MPNSFMTKVLLSVLSLLPMGSLSLAATSKLTDLESGDSGAAEQPETQADVLTAKSMLFEPMAIQTTTEAAFQRYQEQTGAVDPNEAAAGFQDLVGQLQQRGLVKIQGNSMVSGVPSNG